MQATVIPKISRCRHAISFTPNPISSPDSILSIKNRSKDFRATSKFPSSHSLKIKAFLVAGDSWGLQQATAGLLLEENHEGRRRITGNHWRTCQPAGQWRGRPQPNPALPCPAHSEPALSNAPACPLYPAPLYNLCLLFFFWSPKIISAGH